MKKVINTYYADVSGLTTLSERKLLGLWFDEWQRDGWECCILNEHMASKHLKFAEYERKISTMPSVNFAEYERANHLRWVAMATVGGFSSDYDVMPTGREWEPNRNKPKIPTVFQDSHEGAGNYCPSLAWATKEGYESYLDFVLRLPDGYVSGEFSLAEDNLWHRTSTGSGTPHVSDMFLWRDFIASGRAQSDPQVFQFGQDGWQKAAIIHFPRASMSGRMPRHAHIPTFLNEARAQ